MVEKKYDKYVAQNFTRDKPGGVVELVAMGSDFLGGLPFSIASHYHVGSSKAPFLETLKIPHAHPHVEILLFIGTNWMDASDFDADIVLYMGEEEEEYLIDRPTIVYLPPNLVHLPLIFNNVNKPVLFFELHYAPDYAMV